MNGSSGRIAKGFVGGGAFPHKSQEPSEKRNLQSGKDTR